MAQFNTINNIKISEVKNSPDKIEVRDGQGISHFFDHQVYYNEESWGHYYDTDVFFYLINHLGETINIPVLKKNDNNIYRIYEEDVHQKDDPDKVKDRPYKVWNTIKNEKKKWDLLGYTSLEDLKQENKYDVERLKTKVKKEKIYSFPKYVTLSIGEGDQRRYLSDTHNKKDGKHAMFFDNGENGNRNKNCWFEVINSGKNRIALKTYDGKWLTTNHMWEENNKDQSVLPLWNREDKSRTEFTVIVTSENKNNFCLKTDDGYFLSETIPWDERIKNTKYLSWGKSSNIESTSQFNFSEPVLKKEIINIKYDLENAVKEDIEPLVFFGQEASNPSLLNGAVESVVNYEYTKSEVGTWNNSSSVELGVSASFEAEFPLVGKTSFELSHKTTESHEWGGSTGKESKIASSFKIAVPARTKASSQFVVSKAKIIVPFSYTERVTHFDGTIEEIPNKVGVYSNVDSYDTKGDLTNLVPIDEKGKEIATPDKVKSAEITQLQDKLKRNKVHIQTIQDKLNRKLPREDWETDEMLNERLKQLQDEQKKIGVDLLKAKDELQDLQAQVEVPPKK